MNEIENKLIEITIGDFNKAFISELQNEVF